MIRKAALTGTLLTLFSIPAFAATEYWVAKDSTTSKCEVVTKKPDGIKLSDAGMKTYKKKADAERALKQLADCK